MKITNQEEFAQRLIQLYAANVQISVKKNADYASAGDPFANFKACEQFGVPAERGIIVRMTDKLMRASNLLTREAKVADESILDSLSDLANYAMILRMLIESKKTNEE